MAFAQTIRKSRTRAERANAANTAKRQLAESSAYRQIGRGGEEEGHKDERQRTDATSNLNVSMGKAE